MRDAPLDPLPRPSIVRRVGGVRRRGRLALVLGATLWWGVACGGSAEEEDVRRTPGSVSQTGALPQPRAADSSGSTTTDDERNVDSLVAAILACPRDGLWHACSLERRMQRFGLRAVEQDTQTFIPGIEQAARTWTVGGRTLRVVLLDDATAGTLAATFDSARAAPAGDRTVVWPERATLLHNANLLAIYFGGSDRQVLRISNAILGGPPQPDPERQP